MENKQNKTGNKQSKKKQQQKANNKKRYYNKNPNEKKKKNKKQQQQKIAYKDEVDLRTRPALGMRDNIMIEVSLDPTVVQTFPIGVISQCLAFNATNTLPSPIYWVYYVMFQDFLTVVNAQVPPVSGRLHYMNQILESYRPKQVPIKLGDISYSWKKSDNLPLGPFVDTRGYNFYMYVPNGATQASGYEVQVPPNNPPDISTALQPYSIAMVQISRKEQGNDLLLSFEPTVKNEKGDDKSHYYKDVSAFCASVPYYGQGGALQSSAPAFSAESEVPFQSVTLAGNAIYTPADGRVGRNFKLGGGDPCGAGSVAFLPQFKMNNYNSCWPIQYRFLDLDEVVLVLESWYLKLVQQYCVAKDFSKVLDPYFLRPFSYTAQQFRIAVRQAILSYFGSSQGCSQTLTYTTDRNGFEPFRVGSNCYAAQRFEMTFPSLLIENMRLLQPHVYTYKSKSFNKEKNRLMYVPVWGAYKSSLPLNERGQLLDDQGVLKELALFGGGDIIGSDPNIWDGTDSNSLVCDLNGTLTRTIIQEWNQRVSLMQEFSAVQGFLSGSAQGSLLPITRYVRYRPRDIPLSSVPDFVKCTVPASCIKTIRREIKRENSKGPVQYIDEQRFVPNDFSLFVQSTNAFAGVWPFTEAAKSVMNYFIYPSIFLEDSSDLPTQRQVRVNNLEAFVFDFNKDVEGFGVTSRGTQLAALGSLCAPGTAASKTNELINVIATYDAETKGGFVGDILAGLAQGLIPF